MRKRYVCTENRGIARERDGDKSKVPLKLRGVSDADNLFMGLSKQGNVGIPPFPPLGIPLVHTYRKRSFTLLEVIIASFFCVLIVTFLFESRRQFTLKQGEIEKVKEEVFAHEKIYLRLKPIFLNLERCEWKNGVLHLEHVSFIDREKTFRGKLSSTLQVDQGKLVLKTFGHQENVREQILSEDPSLSLNCLVFEPAKGEWRPPELKDKKPDFVKLEIGTVIYPFRVGLK